MRKAVTPSLLASTLSNAYDDGGDQPNAMRMAAQELADRQGHEPEPFFEQFFKQMFDKHSPAVRETLIDSMVFSLLREEQLAPRNHMGESALDCVYEYGSGDDYAVLPEDSFAFTESMLKVLAPDVNWRAHCLGEFEVDDWLEERYGPFLPTKADSQ